MSRTLLCCGLVQCHGAWTPSAIVVRYACFLACMLLWSCLLLCLYQICMYTDRATQCHACSCTCKHMFKCKHVLLRNRIIASSAGWCHWLCCVCYIDLTFASFSQEYCMRMSEQVRPPADPCQAACEECKTVSYPLVHFLTITSKKYMAVLHLVTTTRWLTWSYRCLA